MTSPRQWKRAHGKPRKTPSQPSHLGPRDRYQITPDGRIERVFYPEGHWVSTPKSRDDQFVREWVHQTVPQISLDGLRVHWDTSPTIDEEQRRRLSNSQ